LGHLDKKTKKNPSSSSSKKNSKMRINLEERWTLLIPRGYKI
jgi:hypothetical protein